MRGSIPYGCGQCLPCRVNRRRQWMWRQYLEGLCHEENSFVTLTYSDENFPVDGNLVPRDLQLFLKKLREQIKPLRVRYFAVGEYGEETVRPHYHLSLFGLSAFTVVSCGGEPKTGAAVIDECWGKGFVKVDEFNHLTAQYVSGYITKKLKDRKDGRHFDVPEFARMSTRPGLGYYAAVQLARDLANHPEWELSGDDAPRSLRVGKRTIPLGRYMLGKLREQLGFTSEYVQSLKDKAVYEQSIDMQALLANSPSGGTFKAAYLHDIEGKLIQVEKRAEIIKKRKSL